MEFRILGPLEAYRDGVRLELGSPRQRALLARLLIGRDAIASADGLIEELWAGDPPETARHALQVYVSRLRESLGPERTRLTHEASGYRLSIEPDELDASRFERLTADGSRALARGDADGASARLREALSLWRGPALLECAEQPFARDEAIRLDELRLATLELRVRADLELGRHDDLVTELRELVARYPFWERFWEHLMLALYRSGRQADALQAYHDARKALAHELAIEPGPGLRQLETRILAQDPTLELSDSAAQRRRQHNLPLQRTSFVGRQEELALGSRLLGESRLVTLTGAPGSGKTRLALRIAADHLDEFAHGVFFVPLAAITDPRLMPLVVARTLGLRDVAGESPLDGLTAFLRERTTLLILDNFEQILEAVPRVGELLDAAPSVKVLVTSRSPLRLSWEQEFPVPPLRIPQAGAGADPVELAAYDAVALFLARARAAEPSFELTAQNASAVAEVVSRLDGIPLALELAAARVKVLTPAALLERLDRRLPVLTGGPSDSVDRHRTMRHAIAWSYELLRPEERVLFRRLAVFRAGFTIDAATAVAAVPDIDVLGGITSLVSKSLLHRPAEAGEARFAMLETIREFGLDELDKAGEQADASRRHALYFARQADEAEPQLTREAQAALVARLSTELENLRAALQYAAAAPDPDLGLGLAGAIWRFWQATGQLAEGRLWLESVLSQPAASPAARAKGLTAYAGLAYWQADYDAAMRSYESALAIYRALGDVRGEADTLFGLSMTATWRGDLDAGQRLADEAKPKYEALGARDEVGKILMAQGFARWKRREFAAARPLWEASLAISRELGDQALAVTQLVGLAGIAFQEGDQEQALTIARRALDEVTALENVQLTVWVLDLIAAFNALAAPEASVRLAGAAASLREAAGGGMRLESLGIEEARSVAARALTGGRIERAWAEGGSLSLQQAVESARALARAVSEQPADRVAALTRQ